MKFLLITSTFFFLCFKSYPQKIIKYYDKDWGEVSVDKSVYYAEFKKEGVNYNCTSYYTANNRIRGQSTFPDTTMMNPIGLQKLYNKNGNIEDSIFFSAGKPSFLYHYYPNGKLAVHFYLPDDKKNAITEAFDEDGNKIKNYIVSKDAEFKGGEKAWISYLKKNVGKEFSKVKDKDVTSASVQIQFIIDENGGVTKAKILKSSGYKEIDRDALRVISESPEWHSAIIYNKPTKAYRVQPFSYTLEPEKKSK